MSAGEANDLPSTYAARASHLLFLALMKSSSLTCHVSLRPQPRLRGEVLGCAFQASCPPHSLHLKHMEESRRSTRHAAPDPLRPVLCMRSSPALAGKAHAAATGSTACGSQGASGFAGASRGLRTCAWVKIRADAIRLLLWVRRHSDFRQTLTGAFRGTLILGIAL